PMSLRLHSFLLSSYVTFDVRRSCEAGWQEPIPGRKVVPSARRGRFVLISSVGTAPPSVKLPPSLLIRLSIQVAAMHPWKRWRPIHSLPANQACPPSEPRPVCTGKSAHVVQAPPSIKR